MKIENRVIYAEIAKLIRRDSCERNPNEDGYGDKIPTCWTVILKGEKKERRVWAICYSNMASFYVVVNKKHLYIRELT